MKTIMIGDAGSIKEIITKMDPEAGNNFHRNCYCAGHGHQVYELELILDQNYEIKISKIETLGPANGK